MDHERREMSEKRETANADRYQTIPRLAGVIASGRAEDSFLLYKRKKSTMLPQAHRVFIGSNARFERPPRNACHMKIIAHVWEGMRKSLVSVYHAAAGEMLCRGNDRVTHVT
ncbi:MAG: hypothetical protein ACLFVO_16240 [Chloroflexaceae bacterium]